MRIDELKANSKVDALVGTLVQLEAAFKGRGDKMIQEGVLEDETGQVKVTFWEDDADKFEEGDKIVFSTGWCKEFDGALQVSAGKFGKVNKVPKLPNPLG